jgi:DNA uptake protein ComE-like DNA-binding protein
MKLAAKAFMKRRPNSEGDSYDSAKVEQNDVTGKFGVVKNSAAKLLLPEVFKLDALTQLIDKMAVKGGMTRFTDKLIPPLKEKKSDEKKLKVPKTMVHPDEETVTTEKSAPKTNPVRSKKPPTV